MILTQDLIKSYIGNPLHGDDVKAGIETQDEHKVHVTGEGYKDALTDIIGKTRAVDYGKRELKKPITLFLTKKIKDELSRWRNTQGTRKSYDFGSDGTLAEEFVRDILSQVWKGGSIDDFAVFLNDALYTDFGGFAIVELGRKITGDMEVRDGIPTRYKGKQKPYIIFKSLSDVHDFRLTGRKVEYLILKYGQVQEVVGGKTETVLLYRVLDDLGDYIYKVSSRGVELTDDPVIPNELGYVPAIQISDVVETPLNDHLKTSHVSQTLPLLQDYMTRHAEHVISEMLHASPLLAIKGTKCTYEENGHKCSSGKIWRGDNEVNCPNCNGVGATVPKNSSEIIIVPELDKEGKTYDPSLIGQYITPPVEILSHQAKELDDLEQRVIYSGTGIKSLVKAQIQTATEIVLNLKPLEDKISSILDNIERVEKFMTDSVGKMYYKAKYGGCQVHYGRKLNIRDENLILNEIEQSKRAGMPESQVRLLIEELIMTRYRNSKSDMIRALMLLDLEPFSVLSVENVNAIELIDEIDKKMKVYFDDYVDRFENEKGRIDLFMAGEPMQKRITKIKKTIQKYNDPSSKD